MSTMARIDAGSFKAATRAQWDRHAAGWNEHGAQVGAWLREANDAMLAMAEIGEGARVLDVPAGAGDQTLDIARRVGARGLRRAGSWLAPSARTRWPSRGPGLRGARP